MSELEKAHKKYRDARDAFWEVHDQLAEHGLTKSEMESHEAYIAADEACQEACREWQKLIKEARA